MNTGNPYVRQFPDLMAGKTVLYCHGFASSGQSGTVSRLRQVMPQARVIAPDLPVHPEEAVALLQQTCRQEEPALIIGTSMGGMYAEQLYGYDRVCVNPALEMGETMRQHGMTGTQQFQNPRQDGIQEFYVDKQLVKEYRERSERRFQGVTDEERGRVFGLFGDYYGLSAPSLYGFVNGYLDSAKKVEASKIIRRTRIEELEERNRAEREAEQRKIREEIEQAKRDGTFVPTGNAWFQPKKVKDAIDSSEHREKIRRQAEEIMNQAKKEGRL